MQLLSTLNSLDNVADGSTRKLLKTATSSGSGNAVTAVNISGDTLTYTKGESFTKASILPNDAGEIKTKYRIAQKGYTGGNTTYWYYPICTLPADKPLLTFAQSIGLILYPTILSNTRLAC